MADVIAIEMIKLWQPVGKVHMATSITRTWDGSWLLKCGRRMVIEGWWLRDDDIRMQPRWRINGFQH